MDASDLGVAVVGTAILTGISYLVGSMYGMATLRSMIKEPRGIEQKVNVEYVKPSQVRPPQWKDIDGDGKYETAITIDGKDYLFRFTGQGKPTLALYTVTPQKVEPGQIVIEK